tara:strand:- start:1435 stop:1635 length:201 start_codon:yes stop_codon:yes gene_type:complete
MFRCSFLPPHVQAIQSYQSVGRKIPNFIQVSQDKELEAYVPYHFDLWECFYISPLVAQMLKGDLDG